MFLLRYFISSLSCFILLGTDVILPNQQMSDDNIVSQQIEDYRLYQVVLHLRGILK